MVLLFDLDEISAWHVVSHTITHAAVARVLDSGRGFVSNDCNSYIADLVT